LVAPSWSLRADKNGFAFSIADASLAHNARRIFATYLASQTDPVSDVDGAELIFGELVANVARHAPGPVEVRVAWRAEQAAMEVWDKGLGYELQITLPDAMAENHRGLFIVAALGSELHVSRRRGWNITSVILPVRRRDPRRPVRVS
jgi:anti-sigma regulatory factor (Ser/Thr protein kinase)